MHAHYDYVCYCYDSMTRVTMQTVVNRKEYRSAMPFS